jgi:hypothetical protein
MENRRLQHFQRCGAFADYDYGSVLTAFHMKGWLGLAVKCTKLLKAAVEVAQVSQGHETK